jgi:hypothetical protein
MPKLYSKDFSQNMFLEGLDRLYLIHYVCLQEICFICELWDHKDISDTFYLAFSGFRFIYEGLVDSYVKKCEELEEVRNAAVVRYIEKTNVPVTLEINESDLKASRKKREQELDQQKLSAGAGHPSPKTGSLDPKLLQAFKRGSGVEGYEMDFADTDEISERERAERVRINEAVMQMRAAMEQKRVIDYEAIKDPKIILEFNNQLFEQLARENRAQQNVLRKAVMEFENKDGVDLKSPGELQRLVHITTRIVENIELDKLHLSLAYDSKKVGKDFGEAEIELYRSFSDKQRQLMNKVVHMVRRTYEKETRDVQCGTHFTSKDLENLYISASVVEQVPNTEAKKEMIKIKQELAKANDAIRSLKDQLEETGKELQVKEKLIQGLNDNIMKLKKMDQAYKKNVASDNKLNLSVELKSTGQIDQSAIAQLREELQAKENLLNSRTMDLESQRRRNEQMNQAMEYARKVASSHGILRTSSMADIQVIMKLEKLLSDAKEKLEKAEADRGNMEEEGSFMLDIGNGMLVKKNVRMKHASTDTKYLKFKASLGSGIDLDHLHSASKLTSSFNDLHLNELSPRPLTLSVVNIAKFFPKKKTIEQGQATSKVKLDQTSKTESKNSVGKYGVPEKQITSKISKPGGQGRVEKNPMGGQLSPQVSVGESKSKKVETRDQQGQISKPVIPRNDRVVDRPGVKPSNSVGMRMTGRGDEMKPSGGMNSIIDGRPSRIEDGSKEVIDSSGMSALPGEPQPRLIEKLDDRPNHNVDSNRLPYDLRMTLPGDLSEPLTHSGGLTIGAAGNIPDQRDGAVNERPDISDLWAVVDNLPDHQAAVWVTCHVTKAKIKVFEENRADDMEGQAGEAHRWSREPDDHHQYLGGITQGEYVNQGQPKNHFQSATSSTTLPTIRESGITRRRPHDVQGLDSNRQDQHAETTERPLPTRPQRAHGQHQAKHYSSAVTSRKNSLKEADLALLRDAGLPGLGSGIGIDLAKTGSERTVGQAFDFQNRGRRVQRVANGKSFSSVVHSDRRRLLDSNRLAAAGPAGGDQVSHTNQAPHQSQASGVDLRSEDLSHLQPDYRSAVDAQQKGKSGAGMPGQSREADLNHRPNKSMAAKLNPDWEEGMDQNPDDRHHGSSIFSQSQQGNIPSEYQVFVPVKSAATMPDHLNILVGNKHEDDVFLHELYTSAAAGGKATFSDGKKADFSAVGHAIQLPSFAVFKVQARQFAEQHAGCGPQCSHLKRFYERCGLIAKDQLQKVVGSRQPYLLPLVDMSKRVAKAQLEMQVTLQEKQHRAREEKARAALTKPVFI